MISKTKISNRAKRKTNPDIVETIELAKKNNLLDLAKKLSGPHRHYSKVNLEDLDKIKHKKVMVIGSVLGQGDISHKKEIFALAFSKQAHDKLKKAGCGIKTIKKEIHENPKLKDVEVI